YPRLFDGILDASCIRPEHSVATRPFVRDVDIPAADERVGLGVVHLEHNLFEVTRADPGLDAAMQDIPVVRELARIESTVEQDVLQALEDVVRDVSRRVRV